jgi:hypothetical protein
LVFSAVDRASLGIGTGVRNPQSSYRMGLAAKLPLFPALRFVTMETMRPKFRLRTLLLLVALCALAAAGYRHYVRVYRPLAFHRQEVANAARIQQYWNSVSFDIPEHEWKEVEHRVKFHSQMTSQYEHALWRPWVQVSDAGPLVPSVKWP